ncbi:MAG: 3-hydroxyacyl-CoA dehydrogenase family protein [Dehalococcoidia bacterium]|nr:3-hydroxyacyl-CoA dehydrogenase family protein [Dehalococcoidia bacterium]
MENILVIGAGFMGTGIAQVAAQNGYRVYLQDSNAGAVDKALANIRWSTGKLESKGHLKDPAQAVQERIRAAKDLAVASKCNWVIEAVYEDEKLKKDLFRELENICPAETILASNTSSIRITRLAADAQHPERMVGLHFFGPVPLMLLVEVIKGEKTSAAVFQKSVDFILSLNKYPVKVMQDIPGFIMNRISGTAFREALNLVEEGIATVQDVDTGMKYGYGWTLGPFEMADYAGLDVYQRVGQAFKAMGVESYAPTSTLIDKMVQAGRLGKKAGKGFYDYMPDGAKTPFDTTQLT